MSLKILITLFILPKDLCIVHPLQVSPNPLNPCLVCHTLHIRSCNSPVSRLSPRAPRQILVTAPKTQFERSEWPLSSREKVIQYDHRSKSANGHQSGLDECVDEPGCGKGGQRTMCKIRSDTHIFAPNNWVGKKQVKQSLITIMERLVWSQQAIDIRVRWCVQHQVSLSSQECFYIAYI